jgi:3-phenylpropionate/cinnamic acid dioxygenase small subunit
VEDGAIIVTSHFLVYRFRMAESSPYVGWYRHELNWVDGEVKIHHKKAVLDMEALSEHGAVSIIL